MHIIQLRHSQQLYAVEQPNLDFNVVFGYFFQAADALLLPMMISKFKVQEEASCSLSVEI